MAAHHGGNCAAPPATHTITNYEDAVFQCAGHVMTAINAGGYGAIYLTPNQMVDFSTGEAVVRFDMSTFRSSGRDWVELWLSPFDDQLALPWRAADPDLTGPPRRAIQIDMRSTDGGTFFAASVYNNFKQFELPTVTKAGYETFPTPSAVRRDTFEFAHLTDVDQVWHARLQRLVGGPDVQRHRLGQGGPPVEPPFLQPDEVVPGWSESAGPDTWHWDNASISSPLPFTMLKADQPYVDKTSRPYVTFASGAPARTYLRFAGHRR